SDAHAFHSRPTVFRRVLNQHLNTNHNQNNMMLTRFLALAFLVIGLSACDSGGETGDGGPDIDARIVSDLPADPTVGVDSLGRPVGTGEATFFDLSENAIVATADSASADWDIAFR